MAATAPPSSLGSEQEYREWLETQSQLPKGFRVGTSSCSFCPEEAPQMLANVNLTLIALDAPTTRYAAMFTTNAFVGGPILVGRARVAAGAPLQAVVINNKVANVMPGGASAGDGGVADCEAVCAEAAVALGLVGGGEAVFASSTGVIGWRLPVAPILSALPAAAADLSADSVLPAAEGIMTTDRYPKVRCAAAAGGGRVVGIAKGAGMIEPHLATMLVYLLTDVDLPAAALDAALKRAVAKSFNCLSVDSDESTSDTVLLLSSGAVPCDGAADVAAFEAALDGVCEGLARDVVRNGEGTNHVLEVAVTGAPDDATAVALGRAVVNSPLFKCAVAGNDPNVGRLLAAVGKFVGDRPGPRLAVDGTTLSLGGRVVFRGGRFLLDGDSEAEVSAHMAAAQLAPPEVASAHDLGIKYPPHQRTVQIGVDLGAGPGAATVFGSDLTYEYVAVNADYRS